MFERLSVKQQQQLVEILTEMHQCVCQAGKAGACDRPFNV
jgi:hypothetical protein